MLLCIEKLDKSTRNVITLFIQDILLEFGDFNFIRPLNCCAVRRGCILFLTLFLILIYCVMRRGTENKGRRIRWALYGRLDDQDYADDVCLLSQS